MRFEIYRFSCNYPNFFKKEGLLLHSPEGYWSEVSPFPGKNKETLHDALEQLKAQHLQLLFEGSGEVPTVAWLEKNRLFPDATSASLTPRAGGSPNRARLLLAAGSMAGSTLLLLALFLIYRFSLLSLGDNLLKAVSKG